MPLRVLNQYLVLEFYELVHSTFLPLPTFFSNHRIIDDFSRVIFHTVSQDR